MPVRLRFVVMCLCCCVRARAMGLIRGSQVMRIVTTALLHGRPAVEKHEPVLRAPFDQELPGGPLT